MAWVLELRLGSRFYRGCGTTPQAAWLDIPGKSLDPNIQMGCGHWVDEAAKRVAADADLTELGEVNKYNPQHWIQLTFDTEEDAA